MGNRRSANQDGRPQEAPPYMRVLIVESDAQLGGAWKRHFEARGFVCQLVHGQDAAIECLRSAVYDVILMDLVLTEGAPLAVADFANYRQPDARVIFVTDTCVFSDGSIFRYATNACALLNSKVPPSDLVAMIDHFGTESRQMAAARL